MEDEVRIIWQRWYRDSEGRHRCDFSIANEPLDAKQVDFIRNAVDGVSRIRPILFFFDAFRRNYSDLLEAYDKVGSEFGLGDYSQIDAQSFSVMSVFQHRTLNFINSAALMLERVKSHLGNLEEQSGFTLERVSEVEHRAFDEFSSYRLCCQLRNFSQHRDLPIGQVGVSVDTVGKPTIRLTVDAKSVLKGKRKLRDIVDHDYKGSLDLVPELQEYYCVCSEIFLFMARFAAPNFLRLIQLRNQIFELRPADMEDAEPALWYGPMLNASGTGKAHQSSFSFSEVEIFGEQLSHCAEVGPGFLGLVRSPRKEQ